MATVALLFLVGLQFGLPSGTELPLVAPAHASLQHEAAIVPQNYRFVMAHPIFAPDRAPPPAETEEAGSLSGVEVLGTAIAGKTAAAALLRDSEGTFQRVKIGEEVEGWKLVSIAPKELIFDRNGERRSLEVDMTKLRSAKPGAGLGTETTTSKTTSDDDSDDEDDSEDE
ncbi:MAG: hypothetical protein JOZ72_05570 [Alphaproteobacteria bacterium]|nr:hypothetical protein [Alphaproteobacteria bacterium]